MSTTGTPGTDAFPWERPHDDLAEAWPPPLDPTAPECALPPDRDPRARTGPDRGRAAVAGTEPGSDDSASDADAADTPDYTFDPSMDEAIDAFDARPAGDSGTAAGRDAEGRGGRDRPIAPREYYAISEVCEIVGLKPHVLRYWETQFPVLNPSKNRSGNRVYQRKEIRLILLVKQLLYEEKYTVEGARARLEQLRRGGTLRDTATRTLDLQLMELIREDMQQLLEILTLPAPGDADSGHE
jgi:DNA-binding transcriptional MerR regulator